jgi:hypothetical protein
MPQLCVPASVDAILNWDYDVHAPKVAALSERALNAQWNASVDLDWSIDVPFGAPLRHDSDYAIASFASAPFAHRGKRLLDAFRWELQSWMVSQFLHGEQGALIVAARLVELIPGVEGKTHAAIQAVDEARHVEVFSRYLRENVPAPYPVSGPLESLLSDILADSRWDVTAVGMQIVVEALAMAAFRLADSTFHDQLIKDIARLVARDEARHVSFGVLALAGSYSEMTRPELADREDMVLEAASTTRRRFMFEEVWERLDVPAAQGIEFAAHNEMMVKYRQAIFRKAVSALRAIGLLTDRVIGGLAALDLLPPSEQGGRPLGRRTLGAG